MQKREIDVPEVRARKLSISISNEITDHFAPKNESVDIIFKITDSKREIKAARIEIDGANYPNNPVAIIPIEDDNLTPDIDHTIKWDGKCNCREGPLSNGRFINPLYSPYKIVGSISLDKEFSSGVTSSKEEKSVKILYHSLIIGQGPWTHDGVAPEVSKEKDWAQFKLNKLGYYAGAVGKDFEDYLKKAIIRYKASHKKMHESNYHNYNDTITNDLKTALKNGDNPRTYISGNAFNDPHRDSNIFVEALTYESGEFAAAKHDKEKERLNRPLIPLEVNVLIKKKDNSGIFVPEAVGDIRINWKFTDPDEDLNIQYAHKASEPSFTRKYIEKGLKVKNGRTGTNGDNCHKDFSGIREAPDNYWDKPFLIGDHYEPHKVEKDDTHKAVFSKACIDKNKYPKRLGKAGVFFRPSFIAADSYKLKAEVDFTGLGNKDELESMHGVIDADHRVSTETGTFQIWRFNKIAMLVNWPARTGSNEWDAVKQEFRQAYLEIEAAGIVKKKISDVITEADYKRIVKSNTAHNDESKIHLYDDSICGVDLPTQGALSAADYKSALKTFTSDDYWKKIYNDLRKKISENIRKDYPSGFIVINFLTHKPVNIKNNPPIDDTVTPKHTNYITWSFSIGLEDSVIFIDQKDPDKVYYVVAHEMGHNFWLKHWENAGGSTPNDHDQKDHNCLMSYSSMSSGHAHHKPGDFTPHFCGKCNLKLRGWNIDHADIPLDSS